MGNKNTSKESHDWFISLVRSGKIKWDDVGHNERYYNARLGGKNGESLYGVVPREEWESALPFYSPMSIAADSVYSLFLPQIWFVSENVVFDFGNQNLLGAMNDGLVNVGSKGLEFHKWDFGSLRNNFTSDMLAELIAEMLVFSKSDDCLNNSYYYRVNDGGLSKISGRCVLSWGKGVSDSLNGALPLYDDEVFKAACVFLSKCGEAEKYTVASKLEKLLNITPELMKSAIHVTDYCTHIDWVKCKYKQDDMEKCFLNEHFENLKKIKGIIDKCAELKHLGGVVDAQISNFKNHLGKDTINKKRSYTLIGTIKNTLVAHFLLMIYPTSQTTKQLK